MAGRRGDRGRYLHPITPSAATLLVFPTPAQAAPLCNQWVFPPDFQLKQADGWLVKIPTLGPNVEPGLPAVYWKPDKNDPSNGTPSGGVQGNKISITIPWSNGSTGTFTGNIEPDGRVTSGTSRFSSNFQTTWTSQKMVCADKAVEEATKQDPTQPKAKTATVVGEPVAVYPAPNVNDDQESTGDLAVGSEVELVGECQPENWCQVKGAAVPGGQGFIWGHLKFNCPGG